MTLLAELTNDQITIILVAAGVALVLLRFLRLKPSASGSSAPARHSPEPESRRQAMFHDEQTRWEVQMYDTARDLMGQLDCKIVIVQQLCLRAEQQAARLELAIEAARQKGILANQDAADALTETAALLRSAVQASPSDSDPFHRQRAQVDQLAQEGKSNAAIAAATGLSIGEVELILSTRVASRS